MNKISTEFEVLGFFEEYFVDGKYVGTKNCDAQPNRDLGWFGRKTTYATQDLYLDRNKKITAGTKYYTYVQQLCGKLKGTQEEKISNLHNLNAWRYK
tara:strand:+ start:501 stop:791 length:291 start_codon:yes stop_codon:yes gene_type:complete